MKEEKAGTDQCIVIDWRSVLCCICFREKKITGYNVCIQFHPPPPAVAAAAAHNEAHVICV